MILYFTLFLGLIEVTAGQNATPCPGLFSYEPREKDSDRWYGEIIYSVAGNLTGVWLHVILDKPADILGNWFGQVTTCDNTVFVIRNQRYSLQIGQYFSMRFFVKFNSAKPIPSLRTIKINENVVCSDNRNESNNELIYNSKFVDSNHVTKLNTMPSNNEGIQGKGSSTNLAETTECGIVASRPTPLILQGQETSPGQWPWHAALYHQKGYEIKYACGATLITVQHVITAAHCVTRSGTPIVMDKNDISIGLGRYNLKSFEEDFQHVGVSQVFVHLKYNHRRLFNDIAILKLSSLAEINDFVRPCCLWDEDSDLANVVGREGIVVGWGINGKVSHKLMQATMPVVSTEDCISSKADFLGYLSGNNYCAGYRNGTTLCRGDSGGAMVFPKKEANGETVWRIRGIVSQSLVPEILEKCETSNYNIFTDVAKFSEWIRDVISIG